MTCLTTFFLSFVVVAAINTQSSKSSYMIHEHLYKKKLVLKKIQTNGVLILFNTRIQK